MKTDMSCAEDLVTNAKNKLKLERITKVIFDKARELINVEEDYKIRALIKHH